MWNNVQKVWNAFHRGKKEPNNHFKADATEKLAITHIVKDFHSVLLILKCDKPVSVHKDNILSSVPLNVRSSETISSPLGHSKAIQHNPHICDGTMLREDMQQFTLISLQRGGGQKILKQYWGSRKLQCNWNMYVIQNNRGWILLCYQIRRQRYDYEPSWSEMCSEKGWSCCLGTLQRGRTCWSSDTHGSMSTLIQHQASHADINSQLWSPSGSGLTCHQAKLPSWLWTRIGSHYCYNYYYDYCCHDYCSYPIRDCTMIAVEIVFELCIA